MDLISYFLFKLGNHIYIAIAVNYFQIFILCRIPRGLLHGICVLAKSVPVGQNFEIRCPLAARIEILKILQVCFR